MQLLSIEFLHMKHCKWSLVWHGSYRLFLKSPFWERYRHLEFNTNRTYFFIFFFSSCSLLWLCYAINFTSFCPVSQARHLDVLVAPASNLRIPDSQSLWILSSKYIWNLSISLQLYCHLSVSVWSYLMWITLVFQQTSCSKLLSDSPCTSRQIFSFFIELQTSYTTAFFQSFNILSSCT